MPVLNIVPENEADSDRIHAELLQRWPQGLDVNFIKFEDIQKVGWRQKFRHVIDQRVIEDE